MITNKRNEKGGRKKWMKMLKKLWTDWQRQKSGLIMSSNSIVPSAGTVVGTGRIRFFMHCIKQMQGKEEIYDNLWFSNG
jgi:hypothetical protein